MRGEPWRSADKQGTNPNDQSCFNVELNKTPVLFADDESVMQPYRLFASNPGETSNIYPGMEALTKSVRIAGTVEKQEFERVLRVR